jgi:hypothetical protein
MDITWDHFDMLIRPLWRISDELVPIYNALTSIHEQLQNLAKLQQHSRQPPKIQATAQDQSSSQEQAPIEDLSEQMIIQERELWNLQDALHKASVPFISYITHSTLFKFQVETNHIFDGKFYGISGATALRKTQESHPGAALPLEVTAAHPVPSGQAIVSNLLSKCYRIIHNIQEHEVSVHPSLYSLQIRLEDAVIGMS